MYSTYLVICCLVTLGSRDADSGIWMLEVSVRVTGSCQDSGVLSWWMETQYVVPICTQSRYGAAHLPFSPSVVLGDGVRPDMVKMQIVQIFLSVVGPSGRGTLQYKVYGGDTR